MWDAIDDKRDVAAIAAVLAERYQGAEEAIASDVNALLADFGDAALVEQAPV